jgi:RNA polymerase sigma factor (sigma-70 family)
LDSLAEKEYWQFIWDKFRSGDREAFETIYNEFVDVLFSYGSRITSDRALLRDAIHDMFIDLYKYNSRLRNPESLEYYLFKTLKHNIYGKLRENSHYLCQDHIHETFDLSFSLEESSDNEIHEEHLKILQKEVQYLDVKKRELLFLKFNSGLTYKEIGDLLTINPDTVKKQVYRIIQLLRGKLEKKFINLFVLFHKSFYQ